MGVAFSSQNPSPTTPNPPAAPNMSSSPSIPQNPDPKSSESENPDPKILEDQIPEISDQPSNPDEKGRENGGEEEEEEEGECGFCLFMKGGGCKDEFVAWEKCVEDSEKNQEDIVEKCFEVTGNLKKCMIAHSDYYEPILRAEKAAEEEVKQEMDREAAAKSDEQGSDVKVVEEKAEIEVQKEN
ncbi:uncharacterized protein LOC110706359 [Chenopodium quinoa]|uniref:uncharacterized protein LOC110706359 n=1 Tax=Chenopodium quinoa TaxID=63459 RepID=UPI000B7763B6|nr:uncharacterized protein LOC110706359 [Chenopodium quinoa]